MRPITSIDLTALIPFFIVCGFGLIVLALDIVHKGTSSKAYLAWLSVLGLVSAFISAYILWDQPIQRVMASNPFPFTGRPTNLGTLGQWLQTTVVDKTGEVHMENVFTNILYFDGFTLFFTFILILAGILVCLLSPAYLEEKGYHTGEYYALILFSISGMILMVASADMIMLFVSLEVMSIAAYVLAGFFRNSPRSAEASLKYFILGAFSTGILLYGMALVYGATGTTNLDGISLVLHTSPSLTTEAGGLPALLIVGLVLILVGIGFKIAAVPFHMWTPDVYTGSPTTVVAFMATAVKAAAFAALIRVLFHAFPIHEARFSFSGWVQILFYLSMLTMVVGNVLAMVQSNVKRMLAYSSIAHAGYLLIGVAASGYGIKNLNKYDNFYGSEFIPNFGLSSSVLFYLLAYTVTTIGAFGIIAYLSKGDKDCEEYTDFNGLNKSHPFLAALMAIFMLSSAGIPPTAGFVAKFGVFKAALFTQSTSFVVLAVVGVLASLCGVFYYLRVIVHMYMYKSEQPHETLKSRSAWAAIVIAAFATLYLGIMPDKGVLPVRPISACEKSVQSMQLLIQDQKSVLMCYKSPGCRKNLETPKTAKK